MQHRKFSLALIVIVLGLVMSIALVQAAKNPNPAVFPPNAKPYGMTYHEWTVEWWRYVTGLPADQNPLTDPTGERCGFKQVGPVFFLVGTAGGDASRQLCEVPAGKAILFPILNVMLSAPEDGSSLKELQTLLDFYLEHAPADALQVTIDNVPLDNLSAYRFPSSQFDFWGAEDNVYASSMDSCAPECYVGYRELAVADGYWIMMPPLPVGEHTFSFHGEFQFDDSTFATDVSYTFAVVPGPRP